MISKGNRHLISLSTLVIALVTTLVYTSSDVTAAKDWGGYMWKIEGKRSYVCEVPGKWRTGIRAKADGEPGDTISMGTSKSVSNSISASCGISKKLLNATFRFDVNRQWSANASKSYGLSKKKKGTWWAIKYKTIHKKYRVKARRYSFHEGRWHKTRTTKWIYAKRFDHFAYKLTKSEAPR